jgi:hypothetical protein
MEELFVTLGQATKYTLSPQEARMHARRLKFTTIRDAFRVSGHKPLGDPRVLDGPIPAFLNGFDVTERGVTGPKVGELLREAARLQDFGVFVDRVEALEWLDAQTSA